MNPQTAAALLIVLAMALAALALIAYGLLTTKPTAPRINCATPGQVNTTYTRYAHTADHFGE